MGWSSLTQLRFNSKGCRLEDAAADSAQRLADRSTGRRDTGRRGYPVHPSSALTTVPGLKTLAKLVVRLNWNKQRSVIIADNSSDANHVYSGCHML